METLIIILIAVLVVGFGTTIFMLSRKKEKKPEGEFIMLQNQINEMNRNMQNSAEKIIRESAKIEESNKQVFDIADQLKNLEYVLKNQKRRGNLGEAGMELILANILPPNLYETQYKFEDGDRVDAIIHTKEGIIPIDAKFSLENYEKLIHEKDEEVRNRIENDFVNDIKKQINKTSKYIKPNEGTLPFAFMYVPSEAIYYDMLVNEVGSVKSNTRSIIEYANKEKNVFVVSPITFYAYLRVILDGFNAFQVEESAKEIRGNVENLIKHMLSYEEYLKKLGASLGTTVNHYNNAYKELNKVDKDIFKITGKSTKTKPVELDKPKGKDDED